MDPLTLYTGVLASVIRVQTPVHAITGLPPGWCPEHSIKVAKQEERVPRLWGLLHVPRICLG